MFAPRLLVATLLSLGLPTASVAAETTMTVHVDRPGVKISPTLYGIFFEEINRAGDGGLYAEMLQNRSFEDDRGDRDQKPTKIPGWRLVLVPPGTKATFGLDNSEPLDAQNPHSLRLEIASDKADQIPMSRGQRVDSAASRWSRAHRTISLSMLAATRAIQRSVGGPARTTKADRFPSHSLVHKSRPATGSCIAATLTATRTTAMRSSWSSRPLPLARSGSTRCRSSRRRLGRAGQTGCGPTWPRCSPI